MKNNLRSILTATLALTVIAGVITALLAGTNLLTRDTIAELTEQAATKARQEVIAADSFDEKTITVSGKTYTYHHALKNNQPVGYVFTIETSGKSGGLVVMTGIDLDGKVTGVKVTENNETVGYIDKVTKGGLFDALVGQSATAGVDTVSQATKTSKGILDGVDKALALYAAVKGEGQR